MSEADVTDRWMTLVDAAAYLSCNTKTLRRRIADGSLPAHRLGSKVLRVRQSDLDSLLQRIPASDIIVR